MRQEKIRLQEKSAHLHELFKDRPSFTVADIESVLQEKRSTLHWTLHNLTREGHINRVGRGLYSFRKRESEAIGPIPSRLAVRILDILRETGHNFFISGLDILTIFMEHVPETYPVLLFAEKAGIDEVADILSRNRIDVIPHTHIQDYSTIRKIASVDELTLLIPTREFTYAANGMASFEKAFVDMYFEVSRRDYPLPLQELVKIYINMRRRTALNTNRLVKIASRRNIHQDIRHIVENDGITDAAMEFVRILRKRSA